MTIETANLLKWRNNPIRGLNEVVDSVEKTWFEKKADINSGTHPAIFCADLTVGMTYGFLTSLSDAVSQVFSAHARSISELSRNMNDVEFYGLFGTPALSKVNLIIAMDNLIALAPVAVAETNGVELRYQKMLIPKDTQFDVAGYQFCIENGIEIRYNERTGVQVVYDSTTNNPFNAITSNVLKRRIKVINGREFLIIDVPVRQIAADILENVPSTVGAGCSGTRKYSDYLYGVRAFITPANGVKTEMVVTYDQAVFDPGTLTMTIDLDTSSNQFVYSIPDIYIENGLGVGTVSIYTYTTKGTMEKDFKDTDLKDYVPAYRDFRYSQNDLSMYSDFIPNMGGIVWKFADSINGGTIPNSFSKIKYGVVNGRRLKSLPITENNVIGSVEDYGYSAVKSIDVLTKRLYSLTKELPVQSNKEFYSGVNCYIGTNLISAKQLVDSGVAFDNGARVTIPSGTLYDVTSQVPQLMTSAQVNQLKALTNNALIAYMETRTLAYLPYHYVFDTTSDQAALRMYYLDNPSFGVQSFQEENTILGIEIGVDVASVIYENNGYTIYVQTASGQSFKSLTDDQIGVQLSIAVTGSTQYASVKGQLAYMTSDNERVYRFRLETNFDIDVSDMLHITNMSQYNAYQPDTPIALEGDVSIIFMRNSSNWQSVIAADNEIDRNLFPNPMQAIIKTNIELSIGKRLNRLYNRVRPLVGEGQYQKYEFDVPATYPEDVWLRDETPGPNQGKLILGPDGLAQLVHAQGTPMLNENGGVIYKHRKNDWVKDDQGNYVELVPRELKYHWDFMAFDGVYALSADQYDKDFAQSIKDYLVNTISEDVDAFMDLVIDQTVLLYQPKSKLSWKKVIVNSNYESVLKQDLSFEVTYYLTKAGYNNTNLKDSLKNNTPKILNNFLYSNMTVGISKLVRTLMENLPDDVVDVKINAISGDNTVDVISTIDDLSGFSVRKKLVLGDNKLPSIQEDVKVDFLKHDAANI